MQPSGESSFPLLRSALSALPPARAACIAADGPSHFVRALALLVSFFFSPSQTVSGDADRDEDCLDNSKNDLRHRTKLGQINR